MAPQSIGENLTVEVKGKKTIITVVDNTKSLGRSKSGKSDTIATTRGNCKISVGDGEHTLGLNYYQKVQA